MAPLNAFFGHRFTANGVATFVAFLGLVAATVEGAEPARPQEVRAVFLLNLTRFVRWPTEAFTSEESPLVIGVLANDPIAPIVSAAATGENAGKHPIAVRSIRGSDDFEGCHVVYLSSAGGQPPGPVAALNGRPVLLVGDSEGFLRLGGHVRMFQRGGQVRLRMDLANLRHSGLSASSSLLRVAEVINE